MRILTKSAQSAQAAVAKAQGVVDEWNAKAAAARAEAAELDATAGAMILADASATGRIADQVQTLERNIRVYDQAATEAGRKLIAAHREALEAEAHDFDKQAAQARKLSDGHDAKVSGLLAELKELDGCDYAPGRDTSHTGAEYALAQNPRSVGLRNEAVQLEGRAASIRYYIRRGKIPLDYAEMNEVLGTQFNSLRAFTSDGVVPASLYAARSAGLTFQIG